MFKQPASDLFSPFGGRIFWSLVWGFVLGLSGFAATPVLDHLFPPALQKGTTNLVTAVGTFEPWPPQVWVADPGIRFEPTTNKGMFTVTVTPDASIGPHFVRAYNAEGASAPRFLIVTHESQFAEQEPNDDFTKPQAIESLPRSLNGRLERSGDVDSFAVKLNAGQTLVASVEAYTLMSPLDAVLRIVNASGVQLALNHDDGRTLDPFLAWTAPTTGTYVVQVFGFDYPAGSDIRFTGNARCVYRLHLNTGPIVSHTLPLGVGRGTRTSLQLAGWNLGHDADHRDIFDGSGLGPEVANAEFRPPGIDQSIILPMGDGPETLEAEPNNTPALANPLTVPGAVTGCISIAGDEDRYAFTVKKGETISFVIQSAAFGFPLDAWLKIEDASGKELARNDDSIGADPSLEWTAPADGVFFAAVGNVLHRGWADHLYRLSLTRPRASLKATVAENLFTMEPGKTNEVKITLTRRHSFDAKLMATVTGLPDGLRVAAVEVPEKSNEAVLKLVASAEAKPFSGVIQISLTESGTNRMHLATMELISTGENNGVPQGYTRLVLSTIDQLWLTVISPSPKKPEEKK
jgi:hypothetical protein